VKQILGFLVIFFLVSPTLKNFWQVQKSFFSKFTVVYWAEQWFEIGNPLGSFPSCPTISPRQHNQKKIIIKQ